VTRRTSSLALPRDTSIFLLFLLLGAVGMMTWGYFASRHLVVVTTNDVETTLWTRQTTVRGALTEAGFAWNQQDIIRPGLDETLPPDGRIFIRVAVPISIEADGNVIQRLTQSSTIAALLRESGVQLKPSDRVYLNGRSVDVNTSLPGYVAAFGRVSIPAVRHEPARVAVERAIPISIDDNGLVSTVFTRAPTLGAAMRDSGVLVYLGDYVSPDLGSPVTAGESVFIRRSRAASITVDGRKIKTRTRAANVAALLSQEGIQLEGKDYAAPTTTAPVQDGINVNVTRVREVFITETQTIPFETRWLPNPDMEIDSRATPQTGEKGQKNRLFKLVYENGKLLSRGLEREWIAKPPQDKIINYGTKVVVRDLNLPDGKVVQYWRLLRMLATSYTAATSGKLRTNPEYGITFLGLNAGRGIVAVDPRVVNLRADVYVPGYGLALAGDTGGRIKGRRIDLGFPEANLDWWYRWVNVYVLTPVPPLNQINFVVSDYPQERNREY
jgi:uncharacterized protein YabE (DUF348 family)